MQTRQIATGFWKKNYLAVGLIQKKINRGVKCCGVEAFKGKLSQTFNEALVVLHLSFWIREIEACIVVKFGRVSERIGGCLVEVSFDQLLVGSSRSLQYVLRARSVFAVDLI